MGIVSGRGMSVNLVGRYANMETLTPPKSYLKRLDVVRRISLVSEDVAQEYAGACDTPAKALEILRPLIGGKTREHLAVILLDARSNVLGVMVVSIGTLSASLVHPREVFQPAILANAAAIIVAHNHPSSDPSPSKEDKETTRRLVKAGELLGIPLLDHVIIGGPDSSFSFKEAGILC